ncbi:MAG: glycosyltransferase family 39 protein [Gemmatimonadaceae bacterium]
MMRPDSRLPDPPTLSMIALVCLIAIGAWLRLSHLGDYPLGVQQDELSNIYDGYSLLRTGADRFGDRFPFIVRGFGENDYRSALYPWLTAIPQAFTGFSVAAGRLPAAILGVISLALVYLFALRLAGARYALATLLFATFSPIYIQYSRLAHEGGIVPAFFIILILVLWQNAARQEYRTGTVMALGLATGLSANAYQATKLTAFLIAIILMIEIARQPRLRLRNTLAFSAMAFVGALPQLIALLSQTDRFFARARVLSVSAATPVGLVVEIGRNYWLNLEPRYLFWPGEIFDMSSARLIPAELPFFYLGIVALALMKTNGGGRAKWLLYAAFVISILPAALTTGNPNSLRASGFLTLAPFFSAAGMLALGSWIASERLRRRVYYPAATTAVVLSATVLIVWYVRSPVYREAYFQKVQVDLATKLGSYDDHFDRIIIVRSGTQEYIYIASFTAMTPEEFQRMPKDYSTEGMDAFRQLGKYTFVPPGDAPAAIAEALQGSARFVVVAPARLPGFNVVDSVFYGSEKVYLQVPARGGLLSGSLPGPSLLRENHDRRREPSGHDKN